MVQARQYIPPGLSLSRSRLGRPSSTDLSSTWPVIVGALSAHEAVNSRLTDDLSYVESDDINQILEFNIDGVDNGLFDNCSVLGVLVRFRAVGTTAVASCRAEVVSNLSRSTLVSVQDFSISDTGVLDYEFFVSGQEIVAGELTKLLPENIDDLRVLFESLSADPIRITEVSVEVTFLPFTNIDDYFNVSPEFSHDWTPLGGLTASIDTNSGILLLDDDSLTDWLGFKKTILPLDEFGAVATALKVRSATGWLSFDGVFAFTALDVDIESKRFIVNLLEDVGVRKLGLLKGDPATFDPTLLASYEATVDLDWEATSGYSYSLEWDETNVKVFSSIDTTTELISVAKSAIGAGTSDKATRFGSGDATRISSRGEMLVSGFYFRGFRQ